MAGAAGSVVFPHGEYLALSQFQGFESHPSALAAEHYSDGRAHLPGLEFLAAGSAGAGHQLRGRAASRFASAALCGGVCARNRRRRTNRSTRLAEKAARSRVALVGGDTLLAKEVRELLEESKPAPYIELISAAAENATMLGADDEEVLALVAAHSPEPDRVQSGVSGGIGSIQPPRTETESAGRTGSDRLDRGPRRAAPRALARSFGRAHAFAARARPDSGDRTSGGHRLRHAARQACQE